MKVNTCKEELFAELEEYYASFDHGREWLIPRWEQECKAAQETDPYARKSRLHEFMCRECPVKLFEHLPFFFEMSSGRKRYAWGGLYSPLGAYYQRSESHLWLDPYEQALKEDRAQGFFHGWNNPVGFDHHCAGYGRLLSLGLSGVIAEAREGLESAREEKQRNFYRSVIRSNRALIALAHRFADEADALAEQSRSEEQRAHYRGIARRARWVPEHPPRSFLEALSFVFFYREATASVEGIGISTFGLLDRLLWPYYEADCREGRLDYEGAKSLIGDLLTYVDTRFDVRNACNESSTTIELGGLDERGEPIYNDLTKMILEEVRELGAVATKINCRISKKHPVEYLERIMDVQLAGLACVMMHNDEVLIPARMKWGQSFADACRYLGCGCHEVVSSETEVCTRADSWISLPRLFLETMSRHREAPDFEALYGAFLQDTRAYYEKIVALKNRGEEQWSQRDPLPLYSSSLVGPLQTGRDVTEGGAKYNTTALSLLGIATLVDSLYAVKRAVYEEKRLSLSDLVGVLEEDWASAEPLRQVILAYPKHGTGKAEADGFSAKVLQDLSTLAGQSNARGGKYLPAVYPHDVCRVMGERIGATPDGRRAHTPLSRGVSPSEFNPTDSPLELIHSLKAIDFTRFVDSFVAEMTLPAMEPTENNRRVLVAVIRAFLEAEGSSLQLNLLDKKRLEEAEKNPELHKDLIVRVCGYSAPFFTLNEGTRREILRRAVR